MKIFNYQEAAFYAVLFDEYEEGPFGFPPGRTKVGVLLSFMFFRIAIVLVCYIHFHFTFYFLITKLQQIILNVKLYL